VRCRGSKNRPACAPTGALGPALAAPYFPDPAALPGGKLRLTAWNQLAHWILRRRNHSNTSMRWKRAQTYAVYNVSSSSISNTTPERARSVLNEFQRSASGMTKERIGSNQGLLR